jgi:hypothetical protein
MVRIFYTAVLILYGLTLLIFTLVSISASQNGHVATTSLLWQSIPYDLFVLLLISRVMQSRNPNWLWLGLPTILAILGFAGYIFLLP